MSRVTYRHRPLQARSECGYVVPVEFLTCCHYTTPEGLGFEPSLFIPEMINDLASTHRLNTDM